MTSFEEVLAAIQPISGWLRDEQARWLWDAASSVPSEGQIVEIGSFRGKSTIVLASAAGPRVTVHAIDPHAGNSRGPGEWSGTVDDGEADSVAFVANLRAAGVEQRVNHVREFSYLARDRVEGQIDLLYIDGDHGYRAAKSDIADWGGRVCPGGTMLLHDAFAGVLVTCALARCLFVSGSWRYLGRERSLVMYRREDVGLGGRATNLLRQAASLPWFLRNTVIKTLRAAGLERFARVLGHTPGQGVH